MCVFICVAFYFGGDSDGPLRLPKTFASAYGTV